ncbi:MAG TPA: hybrid sensor histidine kinase/response regulator [Phenylobacterium sp.]|uniref:ATP-binding response regulator n=1 Tax=Phenylobacterium sp. TaxID=1871053 RepID=UPI002D3FBA31|nr:hybrid sensor histidine kinase/response regulator [Phenylobacterium sp.]HZZ70279.1 hybrid sensor histidine kinase/response regulator [Phenylobacterium sp.]
MSDPPVPSAATPVATMAASPSLLDAVRAEQVRTLYANALGMYATLLAGVCVSGLFVYLSVLRAWIALVWIGVMVVHITVRMLVRRAFQRSPSAATNWRAWANRFTVGAAVAGITWGIGGALIMPPGRFDLQMLLILTITSIVYATLSAFASWFPAFFAFEATAIGPIAVWGALQGDAMHWTIAVCCLIWLPAVSILARRHERTLARSLTLQLENAALADDLRAQKAMVEQASLAKSRFLASASHDLRQPVHALGMFVGALRSHRLPLRSVALIDHVDASIGALDSLFTSLLDISKLDAGVVEGQVGPTPVQPLLHRICRDLEGEAEGKGVRLSLVATTLAVRSDPILLERILRNLVGNAVRYTQAGGVLVGARRRGAGGVSLEVWDSGPGIADDQREAIFEEFYQLSNPDRDRAKGLGLGLAIVRRLTDILGHRLSLDSRPGRGSVFRLAMPRAAAAEAVAQAEEVSTALAAADPRAGVIVAIDDEAAIRTAMAELLRSWGHRVIAVGGGEEAFARLAAEGVIPDMIVCDYRLPGGEDGVAVIRRLQAAYGSDLPAILVTGDTAADRIREAQASGYPLLHKPLSHARLRATVTSLLRQVRSDAPVA